MVFSHIQSKSQSCRVSRFDSISLSLAIILGMLSISVFLSQNISRAPEYMSDSRDFLLITSPHVLSIKSSMETNFCIFTA